MMAHREPADSWIDRDEVSLLMDLFTSDDIGDDLSTNWMASDSLSSEDPDPIDPITHSTHPIPSHAFELTTSTTTIVKKKRRQEYSREYYRRTHPFTPVFKSDIRRTLGQMWVNVLNLGDSMNFKNFLAQFSAGSCKHKNVFYHPELRQLFPTVLDNCAIEETVLHGLHSFVTTPDMTCKLIQCNIIQSSVEKGSTVSIKVHFTGTKMYEVGQSDVTVPRLIHAIGEGGILEAPNPSALIPSLPYLDVETLRRMCVPIDPIHIEADGVFLFKLDEVHAMTTFEFHWCEIDISQPEGLVPPRPPYAVSPAPPIFPPAPPVDFPEELSAGVEVSQWTNDL